MCACRRVRRQLRLHALHRRLARVRAPRRPRAPPIASPSHRQFTDDPCRDAFVMAAPSHLSVPVSLRYRKLT
eukprot:3686226-Pleurochrysis_carterae.AAC.1